MMAVVYGVWFFSCLLFQMDMSVLLSFNAYQKTLQQRSGQLFLSVTPVPLYLDLLTK